MAVVGTSLLELWTFLNLNKKLEVIGKEFKQDSDLAQKS